MNKKHYIQFALALREIKTKEDREMILNFLVPILRKDNPKFNEDRFRAHSVPQILTTDSR